MKEFIDIIMSDFKEEGFTRRDFVLAFIGTILFVAICILSETLESSLL